MPACGRQPNIHPQCPSRTKWAAAHKSGPWSQRPRPASTYMVEVRRIRASPSAIRPRSPGCRPPRASPTDGPPARPRTAPPCTEFDSPHPHKKAGRGPNGHGPQARTWWRCGESNSGPKQTPGRCLQAQWPVRSRTPRTRSPALGIPAGSVLACGIPATSARASPSDDAAPGAGENPGLTRC